MATSYFRARARNPYLRARGTVPNDQGPGPTSNPFTTPTFTQPPTQAQVVMEAPPDRPGATSAPPVDPIALARAEYEAGAPTTVKNKILQALANAGLGFLQGAARDPNNPIAAGIGGAATGGAISAISPKTGRSMLFETIQRPRIEDRMRREESTRAKQQAAEDRELRRRETEADINLKDANRARALRPEPIRARNPLNVPGRGLYDLEAGQIIPGTEPIAESPKQPAPQLKFGRNRRTGRFSWYNAVDPAEAEEHTPAPPPAQPKAAAQSKAPPKVVSRSQVRRAAQENNISESDAAAAFVGQGYRIVN